MAGLQAHSSKPERKGLVRETSERKHTMEVLIDKTRFSLLRMIIITIT